MNFSFVKIDREVLQLEASVDCWMRPRVARMATLGVSSKEAFRG